MSKIIEKNTYSYQQILKKALKKKKLQDSPMATSKQNAVEGSDLNKKDCLGSSLVA